jgi:PAS domain S-box-containing protein
VKESPTTKSNSSPDEVPPDNTPTKAVLLAAAYDFLTLANNLADETETLTRFAEAIQKVTGIAAVGIRMHDIEGHLTFGVHQGFCDGFMEAEGTLHVDRDTCLCTRVFTGQLKLSQPFSTPQGSFCTNSVSGFPADAERSCPELLRSNCAQMGYETLALFPIRSQEQILGLVHVADPRPNQLPYDMVLLMEKAAMQLGSSIEKARTAAALRASYQELKKRVAQRTGELLETNQALRTEIERRKRADEQVRQNQEMLKRVFNAISDPLVLMDENTHVQIINKAANDYYGVECDQTMAKRTCYDCLGQFRKPCQTCRIPAAVKEGRHLEFERQGFQDSSRDEIVEVYPINDQQDKARGAVMRIHDITETKTINRTMAGIQNQASMGMLVSSVAHEIKNPNSFIALNISVLRDYIRDILPVTDRYAEENPGFEVTNLPYEDFRKDVFKLLDTIEHGSRRIDAFLRNLKEFGSTPAEVARTRLSLPKLVERVLDTMRSKIIKTVKHFDIGIDAKIDEIYCDSGVLEQVLVNLLVNAAQAADKSDAYIRLNTKPHPTNNDYVVITVEDNGCGIDSQTRKRIFEPFYSTKVAEGGTGLGLFVCRNLVDQLGGRLHVESELGKGTSFTIELPIYKEKFSNSKQSPEIQRQPPSDGQDVTSE